ncbi:MAG: PA14 domain-containing protein [Phycisphaerales bacterium]
MLDRTGEVATRTQPAELIDTRALAVDPRVYDLPVDQVRRVREVLPPHPTPPPIPAGEQLGPGPQAGEVFDDTVTHPRALWVGLTQTGWNPPDPSIAVGPNHVVMTVNQRVAFYSKAGAQQFIVDLGSPGNPGFFEPLGAGNFCFDPKCAYDQYSGRFIILALETYGTTEAWITIAVSDDSDPNGVWYKYRTDAVITSGTQTYWWDYPGLGFDQDAIYVTGNLYGLNAGAWGAAAFRVFQKAPMLTGAPAVYSTLRDTNASSVQCTQHFGAAPTSGAAFFVSFASSTALRVHAVRNQLTVPTLASTTVAVPSFAGTMSSPTPAGDTALGMIDNRMMNACWRAGKLYAAHTITANGKNVARWYEINTGTWPASGAITLAQSGNVDPGADIHSFFPAIYANADGKVGMVLGVSSPRDNVSVAITGRRPADPAGMMARPQTIKPGEVSTGGRWGDYYDIAVDPADDTTFWAVGEYRRSNGWANWAGSFTVDSFASIQAFPDSGGDVLTGAARTYDVMANDSHRDGLAFVIDTFQSASQRGGTITRSVGTGPGGRDQLAYTAPNAQNGADSFTYTIRDAAGQTSTTAVYVSVHDPATFRAADLPAVTRPALDAAYYDLAAPTALPDFATLVPFLNASVPNLNYASTTGVFATSTRSDNIGAVFTGYVRVPADDWYTLSLESDDGSRLKVGGVQIVDNDGSHGMIKVGGGIGLRAGLHAVRVEFFEGGGGCGLIMRRKGTTGTDVVIPASDFAREVPCDGIDYNNDGLFPDTADIDDFLSVFSGGPCSTASTTGCNDVDFNNDGLFPDTLDIDAIISVFSGGPCLR